MYYSVKIFRWFLLQFCLGTTVLGGTLLDSSNDATIFADSNLPDFPLYKLHVPNADDKRAQSSVICQTEECEKLGKYILSSMNGSVNPCDDFYEYACGNWGNSNPTPDWERFWTVLRLTKQNIQLKIREYLNAKEEPEDIVPIKLAKKWYKACMNEESIKDKGLSSVVSIVSRNGGWPLAMGDGEWDSNYKSAVNMEAYYTSIMGVSSFFDYTVVQKKSHGEPIKPYIQIDGPRLTLRKFIYPKEGHENDYKKLIIKVANIIARETATTLNQEKLAKNVDDLINFEKELWKFRNTANQFEVWETLFSNDDEDDEDSIDANNSSINGSIEKLDQSKYKWEKGINKETHKRHKHSNKLIRDSKVNKSSNQKNIKEKIKRLLSMFKKISKHHYDNQKDKLKRQRKEVAVKHRAFRRNNGDINEWLDKHSLQLKALNNKQNKNMKIKMNKKYKIDKATENDTAVENNSNLNDNNKKDNNASNEYCKKLNEIINRIYNKSDNDCYIFGDYSYKNFDQDVDIDFKSYSTQLTTLFKIIFEGLFKEVDINKDDVDVEIQMTEFNLRGYATLLTGIDNEIMVNYIHWNFIKRMFALTSDTREIILQTEENLNSSKRIPRWLECIREVKMTEIISYGYVMKYFPKEDLKTGNAIVDVIKNVTKLEIERSSWMNDGVKNRTKEKIDKMKKWVGYSKWYNNNTVAENYYKGLNIIFQHFDNALSYEKYKHILELKKLSQEYDEDDESDIWSKYDLFEANAFYVPWENGIALPVTNFEFPWFSIYYPDAVNFGFLGYIISHEMSHAFRFSIDERTFDKAYSGWWDKKMEDEYRERLECFVRQYDSYSAKIGNITAKIYGDATLNENIADSAGLNVVYKAFKFWRKNKETADFKLPGLEDFTDDQMFFLSTAASWCQTIRPSDLLKLIDYDEHSPSQFRVLGGLSNIEEFSKAFSCPVGSKMNPEKKCHIWK
ncbi:neprilysin-2-like [Prorops nasuta]|uniref:neprilysin-2-like n=1 Tax=Prorops nasuta TaxID=863751 RepID=UPI0034CF2CE9